MLFNIINGKIYIGKGANPQLRLADHLRIARAGPGVHHKRYHLIHKAIAKFGVKPNTISTIVNYRSWKFC